MQRFVRWIVLRLVLLCVGLAAGLYYLGPLAAKVVVSIGGRHLSGVDVQVESVELAHGSWPPRPSAVARLTGMVLANPAGFHSPDFVTIRSVTLHVDLDSLVSDTIRINHLILDGVSLNLERGDLASNAGVVLGHLSGIHGEPARTGGAKVRYMVQRLELKGAEARFAYAPQLGQRGQRLVRLPHRDLPSIGVDGGGVDGTVLLHRLVDRLVIAAIEQVLADPCRDGADHPGRETGAFCSEP